MRTPVDGFVSDMRRTFEFAIAKALQRKDKPGNTVRPYLDFSEEHLTERLEQEIEEWRESRDGQELLDIMNMAAFLHLRRFHDRVPEQPPGDAEQEGERERYRNALSVIANECGLAISDFPEVQAEAMREIARKALQPPAPEKGESELKECPNCGATMPVHYLGCSGCHYIFSDGKVLEEPPAPAATECPVCGASAPPESARCPSCGSEIGEAKPVREEEEKEG